MNGIRSLRGARCMTQAGLAEAMSVSVKTISLWESGKREPVGSDYMRLAKILGCQVTDLIPNPPLPPKRRKSRMLSGAKQAASL